MSYTQRVQIRQPSSAVLHHNKPAHCLLDAIKVLKCIRYAESVRKRLHAKTTLTRKQSYNT